MTGWIAGVLLGTMGIPSGDPVVVETGGDSCVITNGLVRVVVTATSQGVTEEYFASDREWRLLLSNRQTGRPSTWLRADGGDASVVLTSFRVTERSDTRATVALTGAAGVHGLTKTISVERAASVVHVTVEDTVRGLTELSALQSTYQFEAVATGRPDFVWTPQLRPDSEDVIADHTFRSPALILQQGKMCAALVPNIDLIQPWRSVQTAADLRVDFPGAPTFSYGIANWRTRAHVYYTSSGKMTTQLEGGRIGYGFSLWLAADAVPGQGFRRIVSYLWDRWGRKNLLEGPSPQQLPFSEYGRKAWREYLPMAALDTVYRGKAVTLLRQGRLAWSNRLPAPADDDCWFTVWFNALRTAYGIRLYAGEADDPALADLAGRVLTLALLAPRHEGIGPSIFSAGYPGGKWFPDQGWGGIEGGRFVSAFNNEWTGIWLLAWADLEPARRQEILGVATALGDFLVKRQKESGVVPSWYDPETLEASPVFGDENAETAGAALFLAELYRRTEDRRYLAAARRAAAYIESAVLPLQKWYDFETFFSCSRKEPGFFDSTTGQHPQNTLSMHQMAEACRSLFELTGESRYLDLGSQILDYLCLYQQVWSPPWLSCRLFGGFGVQNTDGEWSDSRQAYFAVTLMAYARLTGKGEYAERGVAALRAMFSLFESPDSPRTWENYAHGGSDRPGGVTGIHWGTGSALTSVHMVCRDWGDVFVDASGWGVGIDGCSVHAVAVSPSAVSVTVSDIVNTPRRVRLRCAGFSGPAVALTVNGMTVGEFSPVRLSEGIYVSLP